MAAEDETSYYNNADKHRWGRQGGEEGGGRFAEEGREEGEEEGVRVERKVREGKEGVDTGGVADGASPASSGKGTAVVPT